jgi:hypothetical protein
MGEADSSEILFFEPQMSQMAADIKSKFFGISSAWICAICG